MPRRRHNPELDVVGAALFVRLGDGFVAIAPAELPGSPTRFYRGGPPASASGVPLYNARALDLTI
jgi:hypothetical protein